MNETQKEWLKEIELKKDDIVNSLTFYISGESGITKEIDPEEAGNKGAFVSDIVDTGKKFATGEVDKEQAKELAIISTTAYAISKSKAVDSIIDKGIDVVAKILNNVFPSAASLVRTLKEPIKKLIKGKLIEKTASKAIEIFNRIKTKISERAGQ